MRFSAILVIGGLAAAAGCSSSRSVTTPASAPAPPTSRPEAAATSIPPAPIPPDLAEDTASKDRARQLSDLYLKISGTSASVANENGDAVIVADPKTGQRQQRIPKTREYYALRGRLFSSIVRSDLGGLPILREDENAWYIEASAERSAPRPGGSAPALPVEEEHPNLIVDVPLDEAEVVKPPVSKIRLRLEELSDGLPTVGMWRENFTVADLDGDGRPEIITPPPRLSNRTLQIFKLDGRTWTQPPVAFDDPEKIGFEYGGVTAGDLDGDGRPDLVFGAHGTGPAIAYNKGSFHFRIETRGLPRQMSTRSMAVGDLDGDGKLDVLAVSDVPEYVDVKSLEAEIGAAARAPRGTYVPGIDTRAFLSSGDKYVEVHDGLEESCFGYSIGLWAPAPDGREPFFAESCRYQGDAQVLYGYDKDAKKFHPVGEDITERYASHLGAAMGRYQGHPAAFMSYVKNGPQGASRNISGIGVTAYYREESGTWKRKRVYKSVQKVTSVQALAVGDLNGDGLDDVVYGDDSEHRLRIFFQRPDGGFEELAADSEPAYVNHATAIQVADVDGDGRKDIILMFQYLTGDETRAGGLRVFRNLP